MGEETILLLRYTSSSVQFWQYELVSNISKDFLWTLSIFHVPPEIHRRAPVSFGHGQSSPHLPHRALCSLGYLLNILFTYTLWSLINWVVSFLFIPQAPVWEGGFHMNWNHSCQSPHEGGTWMGTEPKAPQVSSRPQSGWGSESSPLEYSKKDSQLPQGKSKWIMKTRRM
jgi:hypothetical protein